MKIINWTKENYIILIILLIAAILRFYHVNHQSVWLDEIHTINEANPNYTFNEVYQALLISEPHPPLYFFIVHILFQIFGYTTIVIRILAAVIGIAGVASIYFLGKELFSKKVGIYASALLAINHFHLFYSQDARMYPLLFLMTSLSFLYLIRFIKRPSYKSAIIYAVFATFMIYCHFFALFALFSQYLILLYFVLTPFQTTRKKFFIYSLVSGIITLILYLPTYKLFIKTSEITSIWIQMPTLDVYTQFFKDFFGQCEIVLFFIVPLIVFFFIQLFKSESPENSEKASIDPNKNKMVFSFIILFIWILIALLLPLIKTYTSLPMLINRYFINILPAVILVLAIAISNIKNEVVRYGMLSIIVIFSLTDIVFVKHYYTAPNKTQFREVSQFILDNNKVQDPVVTSLSWYFPYFLNNDKVQTLIIENNLDNFVTEMAQDSTKKQSFWYVDAHGRPYKVNDTTQKFLDDNFTIANNIDLFDTWTKHYVSKTQDLSKYQSSTVGKKVLKLSNYSDTNWKNGVGVELKMFLIDNTSQNLENIKSAKKLVFSDGTSVNIIGFKQADKYIQINILQNANAFLKQAAYPSEIKIE
jgi:mannosyltransferase